MRISASVLTADWGRMADEIASYERAGVDSIHCDVMDHVFVPNMSFGPPMIRAMQAATALPLDVHLMTIRPLHTLEQFAQAGASSLTVHAECDDAVHLHRVLMRIRDLGCAAGVALNPGTDPQTLDYLYDLLDHVLVMSVNPGYGGQAFIDSSLRKIEAIAARVSALGANIDIAVDGGVNRDTARAICDAGATTLVVGNALITAPDRGAYVSGLRGLMD